MDLFDLSAKITLDSSEYEKGLEKAGDKTNKFGSMLKTGLATAAKVTAAALAAAGTAVVAITKQSIEAYKDFEQLKGGVQKLYGNMGKSLEEYAKDAGKSIDDVRNEWQNLEDSQSLVLKNAQNAYKTAGMSANQYMETATQFSASLINSLGGDTKAAAELTDQAMRAMSDNFNTFGGDFEGISNAFKGFSKQNYTMLDNLKLGYGGTKTEMERLIADANEYAKTIGLASDLSIESFADIITAIDLVQQKQNIAGTTAREASTTIEGSLNSLKASWENLLVGISDSEADFDTLVNNFVESVGTAGDNIIPRVETALQGISKLIERVLPTIAQEVPKLITDNLPMILEAAVGILKGLANGLIENKDTLFPAILSVITTLQTTIIELLPEILKLGLDLLLALVQGITQSLPTLIPAAINCIMTIVDALTDPEMLGQLVDAAIELILALAMGLIDALPEFLAKIPIIIGRLVESILMNLPKIVFAAIEIVFALIEGLTDPDTMNQLIVATIKMLGSIIKGIIGYYKELFNKGKEIFEKIKEGFSKFLDDPVQWGKDLIDNFVKGIKERIGKIWDAVKGVGQGIKDFLGFSEPKYGPLSKFHTFAPDMMELFAKGIRDNEHLITDQLQDSFDFGDDLSFDTVTSTEYTKGNAGTSLGGVTINVNGARYTDERSLAERIAYELQKLSESEAAVYA